MGFQFEGMDEYMKNNKDSSRSDYQDYVNKNMATAVLGMSEMIFNLEVHKKANSAIMGALARVVVSSGLVTKEEYIKMIDDILEEQKNH